MMLIASTDRVRVSLLLSAQTHLKRHRFAWHLKYHYRSVNTPKRILACITNNMANANMQATLKLKLRWTKENIVWI